MCYMVKRIIYFSILTCFLLFLGYQNLQAQSKIEGFYGLRLSMPKNQVTSILNSKSKTYKQTESGNLRIDNAQLGDIEFDALIVGFKNGIVTFGRFFCDDGAGGYPEGAAFSRVENNGKRYKAIFNQMYANFISKYGEPQVSSDDEYIWINKNKITLSYIYQDYYDAPFMRQSRANVCIEYELIDSNSTDY